MDSALIYWCVNKDYGKYFLIAFSRIFLGVHTPQDILVGSVVGLLVMWLTSKLIMWNEKHPEKDLLVMGIGIAIAVAVAVFAALKSYPVNHFLLFPDVFCSVHLSAVYKTIGKGKSKSRGVIK